MQSGAGSGRVAAYEWVSSAAPAATPLVGSIATVEPAHGTSRRTLESPGRGRSSLMESRQRPSFLA